MPCVSPMFSSYIKSIVLSLLGKYVEDFNFDLFQVGFTKGEIILKNIRVKKGVLDFLDWPIDIKLSLIQNIRITFSTSALLSSLIRVEIDGVLLSLVCENWSTARYRDFATKAKVEMLDKIDNARQLRRQWMDDLKSLSENKPGFLEQLLQRLVHNIEFQISNVHIQFEQSSTLSPEYSLQCGLRVGSCLGYSTLDATSDERVVVGELGVVHKRVLLKNFRVYWKVGDSCVDRGLDDDHCEDSDFLVSSCDFDFRCSIVKRPSLTSPEFQFIFSTDNDKLFMQLKKNQYLSFLMLNEYGIRHKRKIQYACLHPDVEVKGHARRWWRFACDAVQYTRRNFSDPFDRDYIWKRALAKRKYIKIFKIKQAKGSYPWLKAFVPEKHNLKLEAIECEFQVATIAYFRALAHAELQLDILHRERLQSLPPATEAVPVAPTSGGWFQGGGGWGSWIGSSLKAGLTNLGLRRSSIFNIASPASPSSIEVTENDVEDLMKQFDYDPDATLHQDTYVLFDIAVIIPAVQFDICIRAASSGASSKLEKPLFVPILSCFAYGVHLTLSKIANRYSVGVFLHDIRVDNKMVTPYSFIQTLIGHTKCLCQEAETEHDDEDRQDLDVDQDNSDDYYRFQANVETNPLNSSSSAVINVKSFLDVNIVIDPIVIRSVYNFILDTEAIDLSLFSFQFTRNMVSATQYTAEAVRNIVKGKSSTLINLDILAPNVIVPSGHRQSSIAFVCLGHVMSAPIQRFTDTLRGGYEHYLIKLRDIRCYVVKDRERFLELLHVLQDMNTVVAGIPSLDTLIRDDASVLQDVSFNLKVMRSVIEEDVSRPLFVWEVFLLSNLLLHLSPTTFAFLKQSVTYITQSLLKFAMPKTNALLNTSGDVMNFLSDNDHTVIDRSNFSFLPPESQCGHYFAEKFSRTSSVVSLASDARFIHLGPTQLSEMSFNTKLGMEGSTVSRRLARKLSAVDQTVLELKFHTLSRISLSLWNQDVDAAMLRRRRSPLIIMELIRPFLIISMKKYDMTLIFSIKQLQVVNALNSDDAAEDRPLCYDLNRIIGSGNHQGSSSKMEGGISAGNIFHFELSIIQPGSKQLETNELVCPSKNSRIHFEAEIDSLSVCMNDHLLLETLTSFITRADATVDRVKTPMAMMSIADLANGIVATDYEVKRNTGDVNSGSACSVVPENESSSDICVFGLVKVARLGLQMRTRNGAEIFSVRLEEILCEAEYVDGNAMACINSTVSAWIVFNFQKFQNVIDSSSFTLTVRLSKNNHFEIGFTIHPTTINIRASLFDILPRTLSSASDVLSPDLQTSFSFDDGLRIGLTIINGLQTLIIIIAEKTKPEVYILPGKSGKLRGVGNFTITLASVFNPCNKTSSAVIDNMNAGIDFASGLWESWDGKCYSFQVEKGSLQDVYLPTPVPSASSCMLEVFYKASAQTRHSKFDIMEATYVFFPQFVVSNSSQTNMTANWIGPKGESFTAEFPSSSSKVYPLFSFPRTKEAELELVIGDTFNSRKILPNNINDSDNLEFWAKGNVKDLRQICYSIAFASGLFRTMGTLHIRLKPRYQFISELPWELQVLQGGIVNRENSFILKPYSSNVFNWIDPTAYHHIMIRPNAAWDLSDPIELVKANSVTFCIKNRLFVNGQLEAIAVHRIDINRTKEAFIVRFSCDLDYFPYRIVNLTRKTISYYQETYTKCVDKLLPDKCIPYCRDLLTKKCLIIDLEGEQLVKVNLDQVSTIQTMFYRQPLLPNQPELWQVTVTAVGDTVEIMIQDEWKPNGITIQDVEMFENQRFRTDSWSSPTHKPSFSTKNGVTTKSTTDSLLPPDEPDAKWIWDSDNYEVSLSNVDFDSCKSENILYADASWIWKGHSFLIDKTANNGDVDEEGWMYAFNWPEKDLNYLTMRWSGERSSTSFVRTRRWVKRAIRVLKQDMINESDRLATSICGNLINSISVHITNCCVYILDSVDQDLLQINLRQLRFSYQDFDFISCFELKINDINVSNCLKSTPAEVILYRDPRQRTTRSIASVMITVIINKGGHIKTLNDILFSTKDLFIKELSVQIAPQVLCLEDEIFSRLLDWYSDFAMMQAMNLISSNVDVTVVDELTRTPRYIVLELVSMSDFSVVISFTKVAVGLSSQLGYVFNAIGFVVGNLSEFPLFLKGYYVSSHRVTVESFITDVVNHYIYSNLKLFKNTVIFNASAIGRPRKIFENIKAASSAYIKDPSDSRCLKPKEIIVSLPSNSLNFIRAGASGSLLGFGAIAQTGGRLLTQLTFDDDYIELASGSGGPSVKRGLNAFGHGLVGSVTGLVEQPLKGYKTEGPKGLFTGIAKGVTGLFTKTTAGTVNLIADSVSSLGSALDTDSLSSEGRNVRQLTQSLKSGLHSHYLKPIIDIKVLIGDETPPKGYRVLLDRRSVKDMNAGNDDVRSGWANLNTNIVSTPVFICVLLGTFDEEGICDVVLKGDVDPLPDGFLEIRESVDGKLANLNSFTSAPARFLCVRRGRKKMISDLQVVIDNFTFACEPAPGYSFVTYNGEPENLAFRRNSKIRGCYLSFSVADFVKNIYILDFRVFRKSHPLPIGYRYLGGPSVLATEETESLGDVIPAVAYGPALLMHVVDIIMVCVQGGEVAPAGYVVVDPPVTSASGDMDINVALKWNSSNKAGRICCDVILHPKNLPIPPGYTALTTTIGGLDASVCFSKRNFFLCIYIGQFDPIVIDNRPITAIFVGDDSAAHSRSVLMHDSDSDHSEAPISMSYLRGLPTKLGVSELGLVGRMRDLDSNVDINTLSPGPDWTVIPSDVANPKSPVQLYVCYRLGNGPLTVSDIAFINLDSSRPPPTYQTIISLCHFTPNVGFWYMKYFNSQKTNKLKQKRGSILRQNIPANINLGVSNTSDVRLLISQRRYTYAVLPIHKYRPKLPITSIALFYLNEPYCEFTPDIEKQGFELIRRTTGHGFADMRGETGFEKDIYMAVKRGEGGVTPITGIDMFNSSRASIPRYILIRFTSIVTARSRLPFELSKDDAADERKLLGYTRGMSMQLDDHSPITDICFNKREYPGVSDCTPIGFERLVMCADGITGDLNYLGEADGAVFLCVSRMSTPRDVYAAKVAQSRDPLAIVPVPVPQRSNDVVDSENDPRQSTMHVLPSPSISVKTRRAAKRSCCSADDDSSCLSIQ